LVVRNEFLHGIAGGEEKTNYKHDSRSNNYHDKEESLHENCRKNGFTFAFLGISLESFFGKKDEEKTQNQESPLILMIKEGIIAFHVSCETIIYYCFRVIILPYFVVSE
jgi:hypothetical protein